MWRHITLTHLAKFLGRLWSILRLSWIDNKPNDNNLVADLTSQRRPSNGNSNGKYTSSSSNLTVSRGCADITVSYQPLQHQSLSASSLASLSHGDVEESYTGNNHTSRKLAAYSNQDDSITKGDDDECNHIFFANQRWL